MHIGNLIAQAIKKVGKEGVISVKESRTIEDEVVEKPPILLSNKKISLLQKI